MGFFKYVQKFSCYFMLSMIAALFFASCGTSRNATSRAKKATSMQQQDVVDYSMKYLKKPYRHSGKGPNSFDCSGFTSFVFRNFGYDLSPSSAGQDKQVPAIRRKEELQVGDLVFFEGRSHNGRVGHVGIVTETRANGSFRFIHAATSSGVIISSSTEPYYATRYLRGGQVLDRGKVYAETRKTSSKKEKSSSNTRPVTDKRGSAFVAAKAKNTTTPQPVSIPEITRDKSDDQPIVILQNVNTPDLTETSHNTAKADTTFVQPKPLEVQLPDSTSKNGKDEETSKLVLQAMTYPDSVSVPKPEVKKIEPDTTNNVSASSDIHIVKPGETLYSISQKYNCTIQQLRQWNPQLGNVLKSSEKLFISKK